MPHLPPLSSLKAVKQSQRRRRNLPVALLVHGGPWGRDGWGYNATNQWFANRGYASWFANRGYASLQVNFRGSTGYGKEFVNAGDREWGAKMHDDLIDTVRWAIDQGIADPGRVAIMGGRVAATVIPAAGATAGTTNDLD